MTNILSDDRRQEVLALGRLGWTLRRIEQATGVRRETAGAYLKAAGLAVRPPGRWGHPPANPAKEVSTDSDTSGGAESHLPAGPSRPQGAPAASACEPYRERIELALARGPNAMAHNHHLLDHQGFPPKERRDPRLVLHPPLRHPGTAH